MTCTKLSPASGAATARRRRNPQLGAVRRAAAFAAPARMTSSLLRF